MKTQEQQKLCQLIEAFNENKNGEQFGQIINQLFRMPLLFPVKKGGTIENMLLAENGEVRLFSAFSDMEEAEKREIGEVDFIACYIDEYAQIIAGREESQGLVINLFSEKNCTIKREFFENVVCPAFENNSIMPGLRNEESQEYVAITKMPFFIGRNEKSDMRICDNSINDQHAAIVEHEDGYYVVDRESLNGTYVNGKQVPKGGEQKIEFDDIIEFSDVEYAFVAMGIANKQVEKPSIYGDDKEMIANAMYVMQNRFLIHQFMTNEEQMTAAMEVEDTKDNFRRMFAIAVEATCDLKEQELKVTDKAVIKEQRGMMIGKAMTIFDRDDYGFTKQVEQGCRIYVAHFPQYLHIPELASRMYFIKKEDGTKTIVKIQLTKDKAQLIRVSEDEQMIPCAEAPDMEKDELGRVLEVALEE